MHGEIDYKDPRDVTPYCYDIFGDECYKGNIVYCGDDGMMLDPDTDNYDPNNPIMTHLVQKLGTRFILEKLGFERRMIE